MELLIAKLAREDPKRIAAEAPQGSAPETWRELHPRMVGWLDRWWHWAATLPGTEKQKVRLIGYIANLAIQDAQRLFKRALANSR